jgi:hypothetical protein
MDALMQRSGLVAAATMEIEDRTGLADGLHFCRLNAFTTAQLMSSEHGREQKTARRDQHHSPE